MLGVKIDDVLKNKKELSLKEKYEHKKVMVYSFEEKSIIVIVGKTVNENSHIEIFSLDQEHLF